MSLKAAVPFEYIKGFKKPRGGFPAAIRASFRRATIPAKVGEDAEVPPIKIVRRWRTISKLSPWAATSGIPYANFMNYEHSM
jgi:hypothetical protein